jgi:hypothetical protein
VGAGIFTGILVYAIVDGDGPGDTQDPQVEVARVTFRGMLTLDGAPLRAEFLGARVSRGGLWAACQSNIPAVTDGTYAITVITENESRGCGAPGARVVLWAFVNDGFVFSETAAEWPDGPDAMFDATFDSASPRGAAPPTTDFFGQARAVDGTAVPPGTPIEAYVGDVLCGTASTRDGEFEGFVLLVAGPESVEGCARNADIRFLVGGTPAAETAPNDLRQDREDEEPLILTLR